MQGLDLISLHFLLYLTNYMKFSLNLLMKKLKPLLNHVLETVNVVVVEVEVHIKTIIWEV